MRRPRLTHSITTRLTEPEYLAIRAMAGADTVSDWLRDRLTEMVSGGDRPTKHEVLLAEVLALRRILLNVVAWSVSGKTITEEALAALITESDAKKLDLARARAEA